MIHPSFPRHLFVLPLALVLLLAAGCDSDSSTDPTPAPLAEVVADTPELGTLAGLLDDAGLASTLNSGGPFTLFAPTDAAFQALPPEVLNAVLDDPNLLEEVLLNHVVSGSATAGSLSDGQTLNTLSEGTLTVSIAGSTVQISGATIVEADVDASNGVIHLIDAVLVPEEEADLVDVAVEAGFSTLVTAVQEAGLEQTLRGEGPFTVFAPTNEAFDDLPDGVLEDLLDDPEALATILTYHVVAGQVLAADLQDGAQVTTVEGRTLAVSLTGGAQVNDANITSVDILASNGVVHVIDAVLIPED